MTNPFASRQRRPQPTRTRAQSGVVLIIALIMLAVIALTSAAVMRSSLSADLVSQNTRRQAQAMQAAQAALRYCEDLARGVNRTTYVKAAAGSEEWDKIASWAAPTAPAVAANPLPTTSGMVSVPSSILTSSNSDLVNDATDTHRYAPQCMSQARNIPGKAGEAVVVVTARGFSTDYQETSGRTVAGAVVWLQSILRLEEKK